MEKNLSKIRKAKTISYASTKIDDIKRWEGT